MKFQDILSSLFFLSLGITFILLLLLVYHFRSRIIQSEQKMESIFEVINDIVKEINIMRSVLVSQTQILGNTHNPVSQNTPFTNSSEMVIHPEDQVYDVTMSQSHLIVVSDNEESDEYSDEDSDEDSDDYTDSEDDDNRSDIDVNFITEDILEQKNETKTDDNKIINIQISENELDDIMEEVEEPDLKTENIEIVNMEQVEEVDFDYQEADLNTENVENIKMEEDSAFVYNEDTLEKDDINQIQNSQREVYKKMTPQALKALIISKGITMDTSKLKKNELIKLLLSNE